MKSESVVVPYNKRWSVLAMVVFIGLTGYQPAGAATNVVLWDTGAKLSDPVELANRAGWKAVPTELFSLEADPAKAASDPGYYGREYAFQGDAVIENRAFVAAVWAAKGRVVLYAKPNPAGAGPGQKLMEILPSTSGPVSIQACEILRNAGDEVVLAVSFAVPGAPSASATISFGRDQIVEVKPSGNLNRIRLVSPLAYAVLPGFIGDDVILSPELDVPSEVISVPSENILVGLVQGGENEWVMTWPPGRQRVSLRLSQDPAGRRILDSVEFEPDGQSLFVAALSAPGLWHREPLPSSLLEKDTPLAWKRPFSAKWKTQLSEAGVRTTFAFREAKGQIWRGVPGSYRYPAWFEGDTAFLHLSKKVPPKGDALIYCLEGQDTPLSIATPADIVKATLGRPLSEAILDPVGRRLRTHHRRGGDGVHRACTCGCTEAMQGVFEAGQEVARKQFVKEALGDMNFFVECHVERIEEYLRFARDLVQFLQAKGTAAPELKSYLEELEQLAQQIPQEYSVQKENMKSLEHAAELTRRTLALTGSKSTNNLPAYLELLKDWRAMGGAQDYVVAQCHTITRKLFQAAALGSLAEARAMPVAQEVRRRCRQILRNPDGYEIWADY